MSPLRRFKRLLYETSTLKQAVGILFVTVLISNVLGLLRNIVIANRVGLTYGTIGPLDNYYAAFVLPDLFYNFIIVGALSSAVLPLLVRLDTTEGQEKFWQAFNNLVSAGLTVIVAAMGALYLLMPSLIELILPGFAASDQELTTQLARVLLLSPLFFTISQLSSSALQAKRFFLAPAIAPLVYNLAIISGALLIPSFGLPVLVFGVIIGAAGHFLVQLPSLLRLGWRFSFDLTLRSAHVREVGRLMIPRALALTGNQLLLLAFYRIASNFSEGSIAIYRLTDDLQTAPVLLLANTLAMAILPDFARQISQGQQQEFFRLIGKAWRLIFYIFLPVTIFLLFFSDRIIELYISIGHSIDPAEVALATSTFNYFVISLFFQATVLLLARAFFARGNTFKPMIISLISIAVALVAATLISRTSGLGVAGLALAFSIGSALNAFLLAVSLQLPVSVLIKDGSGRFNLPTVVLGAATLLLILLVIDRVAPGLAASLAEGPSARNLLEILLGTIPAALFYWAWSRAFKLEQWQLIRRRASTTK